MSMTRKLPDSLSQVSGGPTKPGKWMAEQEKIYTDLIHVFVQSQFE